jgi:hypothetical protein
MIAAVIVLQELPSGGVSVEQIPLTDQAKASPIERVVAGVVDIANRVAGEFVTQNAGKGVAIEGKDIEQHVAKMLKANHLHNFREEMRRAGVILHGDPR